MLLVQNDLVHFGISIDKPLLIAVFVFVVQFRGDKCLVVEPDSPFPVVMRVIA